MLQWEKKRNKKENKNASELYVFTLLFQVYSLCQKKLELHIDAVSREREKKIIYLDVFALYNSHFMCFLSDLYNIKEMETRRKYNQQVEP